MDSRSLLSGVAELTEDMSSFPNIRHSVTSRWRPIDSSWRSLDLLYAMHKEETYGLSVKKSRPRAHYKVWILDRVSLTPDRRDHDRPVETCSINPNLQIPDSNPI